MWILPKNYQLSSRFAQDMVESKEDLTLPGLNIESSLMWRSKPSLLRTWLARWKQGSYLPHLFTRILKPSQRTSFETALTSSLEVIRANPFQQQDSEREPMTQDTSGHLLIDTFKQLDLFDASLKMSKDTFRLDSQASSATWKKMVTEQRGEYSRRVKLAHPTKEKESTSWLTPTASDWKNMDTASQVMLSKQVKLWPTPTATNNGHGLDRNNPRGIQQGNALATAVLWESKGWWPTPTAHLAKEGGYPAEWTRDTPTLTVEAMKAEALPHSSGHLNPVWVEWLMGVPTGWTDLGSWETE